MKKFLICLITGIVLFGCGYGNLDYVKENYISEFKKCGFEVVGYEGYQLGYIVPFTKYGGATVYYILKKNNNGILYSAALKRWGNEIHIYNLKAIDVNAQNR